MLPFPSWWSPLPVPSSLPHWFHCSAPVSIPSPLHGAANMEMSLPVLWGLPQQHRGSEGDVQLVLASARDFMPLLLESFPCNSSEFRGKESFVLL